MKNCWKYLHWFIIYMFLMQLLYCMFQVFVVMQPEGIIGPLGMQAISVLPDIFLCRRLYAIEGWITASGLIVYLAITEVYPRKIKEGK